MAFLIGVVEGDFEAFKQQFDADPLGRKQVAKGSMIHRGVDNPDEVFLRLEFDSVEAARSFHEKIRGSEGLQNMTIKFPPTVTEMVEQITY